MERQINIHPDKLNKLATDRNELVADTHAKLKKIDSRRDDINDKIDKLRIEQQQLEDEDVMKDDSDKGRLQEDGYSSYSSLPSAAAEAASITEDSVTAIERKITARLENMLDGKMNQLYMLMQQNNAQAHAHHPHQHGGQPLVAPPSPSATQGMTAFQPGPMVTPRGSPAPSGKSTPRTKVATPHFDKTAANKNKDKAKDKDSSDVVSIGDIDDDELELLKNNIPDNIDATGEFPTPP